MRPTLELGLAIAAAALGVFSALSMIGEVRLVSILVLFFGGFGAGAGLVAAVHGFRRGAQRAAASPSPRESDEPARGASPNRDDVGLSAGPSHDEH